MRETGETRAVEAKLGELIAQHHAIGAEIVSLLATLDAEDGWQSDGHRSLAHWLSVRGSYTLSEAQRFATAAIRLDSVRSIHAAAATGKHSVGVLAMAARVATPQNEKLLAQILRDAVPTQAARIFAKLGEGRAKNGGTKPDPDVDYWQRHWVDDLGRERYDFALDGPTGALFKEAWQAARALGEKDLDPVDLEQRRRLNANEIATRWARAMLEAATRSGSVAPGDERWCVQVSADLETLARVLGFDFDPKLPARLGSQCFIPATGQRLSDAELARILCDAGVQLLVHHNGVPLWLGNEVRTATRHQRRALRFRAGVTGCEFPGCTQTRFVDAHHVRFYGKSGPTDLDNLILLCGYHHGQIHDNGWTITTEGDQQFTFWRGERCLGTTVRGDSPSGRPPDLAQLPLVESRPDPPPGLAPPNAWVAGGCEPLTNYALGVDVEALLAA
jgi:hypothetical protein